MPYKILFERLPYRCGVLDSPAMSMTEASQEIECVDSSARKKWYHRKPKKVVLEAHSLADRLYC
jgi:hypothetical protein